MNDRCEMQAKDHRFVRWLKVLLRTFLPLNFYNSIKIERVALNYFEFVKAHKEHLVHVVTLGSANRVLTLLNKTTHGKYAKLLSAFKDAIVGNVSQEAFAEETAKQKENLLQARTTFYQLADRFQNKLESLESLTNQRADLSVEGNEKENSQSNEIFQPEEKIQTHSQLKLSTNSQANQENFHENQTDIETVSKIDKLKESVPIMAEKKQKISLLHQFSFFMMRKWEPASLQKF
ncbi:MAG: hypothetical protein HWD61_00130 [Parachlamydiaceae bacterium]|nr:MAG: hypothetical protein HWD61_00130 [Parachlamydiaceae bacterium]